MFVGLSLAPSTASATVAEELSIEELTSEAILVVRARVAAQYVVPDRGPRGQIYTRTELTVLDYLKGDGLRALTVQQLGGQYGDLEMRVTGNAALRPGDEVVVFLDHDPQMGLSYVIGLAQGLFRVNRTAHTARVDRDVSGISFYAVGAMPYALPTLVLDLETLETRVRFESGHVAGQRRWEVRP